MGTVTVVLDDYWRRPEPLKVGSRAAKAVKVRLLLTCVPKRDRH